MSKTRHDWNSPVKCLVLVVFFLGPFDKAYLALPLIHILMLIESWGNRHLKSIKTFVRILILFLIGNSHYKKVKTFCSIRVLRFR
jgi:hypothetical protein